MEFLKGHNEMRFMKAFPSLSAWTKHGGEDHGHGNGKGPMLETGKIWIQGHLIALNKFKSLSLDQLWLLEEHVISVDLEWPLSSEELQRIVDTSEMETKVSTFEEGNNLEAKYYQNMSENIYVSVYN